MTKDEAIEVLRKALSNANLLLAEVYIGTSAAMSKRAKTISDQIEDALKITIEAPTSEAVAEKPQDDRNAASPAKAEQPAAGVSVPRMGGNTDYKRLFIEWWQTSMDDSEFFNRAVIMLGITTDDLHAAQPAADPAPVPAQGIDHAKRDIYAELMAGFDALDHANLADELADLLFALILCVKNGDDPKPMTKAIQEYVVGIVGQARGQQAGVPEAELKVMRRFDGSFLITGSALKPGHGYVMQEFDVNGKLVSSMMGINPAAPWEAG